MSDDAPSTQAKDRILAETLADVPRESPANAWYPAEQEGSPARPGEKTRAINSLNRLSTMELFTGRTPLSLFVRR